MGICYAETGNPCRGCNTSVLVETSHHNLSLCQDNNVLKEFTIALGRGGVDKREKGDNKIKHPSVSIFSGLPNLRVNSVFLFPLAIQQTSNEQKDLPEAVLVSTDLPVYVSG
jgi:hypothetical protein